jgi:nitroreductase
MRYLRADPVSEELIVRAVEGATCASSPGNCQGWDFVVVRDVPQRAQVAEAIRSAVLPVMPPVPEGGDPVRRRMLAGAHHLLDDLGRVPVWIFVCGAPVYPPGAPSADWIPATLYPAAQNLIVAARALGIGSVFTAYHTLAEKRLRVLLGLPESVRIGVTVALGWPARPFGRVKRRPVGEVLHWDRW